MTFKNVIAIFLSWPQGKLLEGVTSKLVCTWSNHGNANLLWFKRNRTNNHKVITKNANHV